MIRTIVVEDQPVAREHLVSLLAREGDVEVVDVCTDGRAAVLAIETRRPDLVFLDVQLPELDGLGVIDAIGAERMPLVVFVTAFDDYAIRAFELHALDYLLKPFSAERFTRTLDRARERLRLAQNGEAANRLLTLARELDRRRENPERLLVRDAGRILFLDVAAVDWVEADGNYVRLHTRGGTYTLRETIAALETRLAAAGFARAHRGALVNLREVAELAVVGGGECEAVLKTGARIRVGRTHRESLENRLRNS